MNQTTARQRRHSQPFAWASVLMVWATNTLVLIILYQVSRFTVVAEIRHHAMGVAIAVASGLRADDLDQIRSVEDQGSPTYRRIQDHMDHAVQFNPDVRYIYTMRRSTVPFSPSTAYEYVVDQPARDRNHDGVIGPEERCEPPGQPYDAAHLPALVEAWQHPDADPAVSPDPPYPDLISGYAPVRGSDGKSVAIVGVDITAGTVQKKLRWLLAVMAITWAIMGSLGQMVVYLYHGQRESRERARARNKELTAQNELLRRTLEQRDRPPVAISRAPQLILDRFDIRVATAGGGVFRLHELDQDHMCFVLADLSEDPTVAALTATSLDLLVERMTAPAGETRSAALPYVDLTRPGDVVDLLSRLLAANLPATTSVALLYGVLDFSADRLVYASVGCPPVQRLSAPGNRSPSRPEMTDPTPGRTVPAVAEVSETLADGDLLVVAGPGAEDPGAWQHRVEQSVARAGSRQPLEVLSMLTDRPVAALLLR